MGLFKEMFKDLTEMGSPIGKLRGKFADLSKLLVEYSFGENRYSAELTKQKIIVTFNESLEIADKCSRSDRVRLYFPNATVEPTVLVAMKAAEYWVDFVLEKGKNFTNSLAVQLIERAEYDLKNKASSSNTSTQNSLSNSLPNFIEFITEMSSVITNFHKITDSSSKLEYKAPIITYGRTMGYNHYIIEKVSTEKYYMYLIANGNGGKQLSSSRKAFSGDQTMESYNEILQEITMELMTNPQYMKIATSGF